MEKKNFFSYVRAASIYVVTENTKIQRKKDEGKSARSSTASRARARARNKLHDRRCKPYLPAAPSSLYHISSRLPE